MSQIKELQPMEYRPLDYFNSTDTYRFKGVTVFDSKVQIESDKVFTVKSVHRMQYRATTIPCIKIS